MSNKVRSAANVTPAAVMQDTVKAYSFGFGTTMAVFVMQWECGPSVWIRVCDTNNSVVRYGICAFYKSSAQAVLARGLYSEEAPDSADTVKEYEEEGEREQGNVGAGYVTTTRTENIMLEKAGSRRRRSDPSTIEVKTGKSC